MHKKFFNDKSKIKLYKLVNRKEDNYYIIGRKETAFYIQTTDVGSLIVSLLSKEKKVFEVKKEISKKYKKVDVDSFISRLIENGFVEKINSKKIQEKVKKIKPILKFMHPKQVSWIFSKPMYIFYFVITFLGVLVFLQNPSKYFPADEDYFFSQSYVVLIPISFLIAWILVFIHEFFHFLAARSRNLPATFGLGSRLIYLVATTDVTNVYSIERSKRYRVYLSGILIDLFTMSLALILIYLTDIKTITTSLFFYKFLKFIVLIQFLGILWQFLFFIKTDIYLVFENLTRVEMLYEKTEAFLKNEWYRLTKKHHFSSYFDTKREKSLIHMYAVFFVIGTITILYSFFYYYIPIALSFLYGALQKIASGVRLNDYAQFYDGIIFIVFFLINFGLFVYAFIREYKLYTRPTLYYMSLFCLVSAAYIIIFSAILSAANLIGKTFLFYTFILLLSVFFSGFLIVFMRRLDRISKQEIYELKR